MIRSLLSCSRFGTPSKPAVVFLHGFLGSHTDWRGVIAPLESSYYLVCFDLPGHGKSSAVDQSIFHFDNCCAAIADTLADLKITNCSLVGYSMGGRIALQCVVNIPQLFRAVVLVGARPGIESESARLSRLAQDEQLAERMISMPLSQFVDEWYQQPLFDSLRDSQEYRDLSARRASGDRELLALALARFSVGRQRPLWGELSKLTIPLGYVAGEHDTKYTAVGRRVVDLCPRAKLHIIPRAGHAVHIEQPEELSRVIASFLELHK